ncbi:MAG TPA: hypothetical protein VNP93_13520 [Gaiellaceae bacterium]|nr:hypothetical protein [Gaiellaceae bacterium]
MRRTIFVAALAAAAIAALPAFAAPPQTTTFSVVEQFSDPPTAGVFTSDGSIVCASGTTENAAFGSGFQSERGEIFHVRKTIICNDGSGTFTLLIQARIGFNVGNMTFGPWVVLSGTGDYVRLHGRGTVTGTQIPGGVSDLYVGWLALR